jgi:hypothetical protein
MRGRIEGRLERTGIHVLESYSIALELDDDQLNAFEIHPQRVLRQFLEQEGHVVNRVAFLHFEDELEQADDAPADKQIRNAFHIVYPDNERSGWICA